MSGLGPRKRALELLGATQRDPLDLLVVGGGITGAGIALDAASRGARVGLVERADFAAGTSSKSSKLVHGGLRYLEQGEIGLIREASVERDLLRRLAPHLVEPLPFVLPIGRRSTRAMFGVGLWAYDALAAFRNLKSHRHVDADQTEDLLPPLPRGKVRGSYLYYDCKNDDVRLVMENLVAAVRYGAVVLNHAAVRGLDGTDSGCEATVEDTVTGDLLRVRARRAIVAAGVWGDDVERLANPAATPRMRPSKGVHLVFPRAAIPLKDSAAFIPDAERKRRMFVIPWHDCTLVGTTDDAYEGPLDAPTVTAEDRAYCLTALNSVFEVDLGEADIAGAFAGLRPLLAAREGATADLSRRHRVYPIAPSIVGITGGKLTTYRKMAADAVDHVAEEAGISTRSRTRWIRLGTGDVEALRRSVERRARVLGIDEAVVASLVRTYGDRALAVLDLAQETQTTGPLAPGHPSLAAEALYAAREEMVVHLSDLLARRTRLALTDRAAGLGPGAAGATLLAQAFGWSDAERSRQEMAHRAEVERERGLRLGPGRAETGARSAAAG